MSLYLVGATIPAILFGVVFHYILPEGIRHTYVVLFTLIFFAIFMIFAEKFSRQELEISRINLKSAMIIGMAQVLAFIPGTSRSGVTIATARLLGFGAEASANFSFLLSIPAVAGAGMLGVLDFLESGSSELGMDLVIAIVLSFLSGLAAIAIMMRFLKKIGLIPFAIYRIVLALLLVVFIA